MAGGRGFRAVWTEVKNPAAGDCDENGHFRCVNSSLCISRQLECDGTLNCGPNDDSDEAHCNYHSLSSLSLALSLFVIYMAPCAACVRFAHYRIVAHRID